jgi:DNA-binding winged helix-turn-helix (wHTH) protein/TolB-like protein/Flp pilus assembly protein TadD
MQPQSAFRFGPFEFDSAGYRLFYGSRPVSLSPKVLDLLKLLVAHPSEVVTKEAILRELWPDVAVTDNAVTQVVSELRHGLQDNSSSPRYIQTVPRRGYRFVAAVDVGGPALLPAPSFANPPLARTTLRALGVSDFQNVTGDADVAWMAVGIAETLSNDLRAPHSLRVLDRAIVPAHARVGSVEAARACGLDLLVVGSYQRSGDRLRVTARTIDTATGEAIAHAKADGRIDDAFQLQDALVTQLLHGLRVPITPTAATRIGGRETSSLDAYRALTEGRLKLETLNPADVPAAIEDFDRAITLDPRYAPAYVGMAHARFWLYEASRARNKPDVDELRVAIAHARRAIELDSGLAEGHAALAFFLASAGQQADAIRAGRIAVELEPNDWRHRFRLGVAAWGSERLTCFDEVVRLYPEFAYSYFGSAMVHVARRELDIAEEILRQGFGVQQRGAAGARRYPANGLHWLLGLIRLSVGDVQEAENQFDRELAARGSELYAAEYAMDAYDGHGFARLARGDAAGAEKMFSEAISIFPDHARSLVGLATARLAQRRTSEAHQALSRARFAIDVLNASGRSTEASMASAFCDIASGRPEDAVAGLSSLLSSAPPGFAGWTAPIEPLLNPLHNTSAFEAVLRSLARRAT